MCSEDSSSKVVITVVDEIWTITSVECRMCDCNVEPTESPADLDEDTEPTDSDEIVESDAHGVQC